MDIIFNCGNCGQRIVVDEAGAGLATECPKCGQSLTVPQAATLPQPKPPVPANEIARYRAFPWRWIIGAASALVLASAVVMVRQDQKIKALEQRVADLERAVGQLRGSVAGVAGMASHAERAVRHTPVLPDSSQRWNGP